MAILKDEKYYRIRNISVDYDLNVVAIGVYIYKDSNERLLEQNAIPKVHNFTSNAHLYLGSLSSSIEDYINDKGFSTDEQIEQAMADDEEFSNLYSLYIDCGNELNDIESKLLIEDINLDKLKFKDAWCECGLDESLCYSPKIEDYKTYRLQLTGETASRENAYEELKQIIGECEDC